MRPVRITQQRRTKLTGTKMWITQNLVDFMICVLATCFITSTKAQGDVSCDFDNGFCGWTQDKNDEFDWTRNRSDTGSVWYTGPDRDHTSGNGYYLYIDTSYTHNEEKARINSPQLEEGSYCMTFWYTMHRPDVDILNVYKKTKQSGEQLIVSRKEGNMDKSWNETDIDISSNATFQIVIECVAGKGYTGDIAIDDILLKSGLCTTGEVSCDFDNGFCNWTQDKNDELDWTRNNGSMGNTGIINTAPKDHTSGDGYYLYIDTSYTHNEEKARISSPQLEEGSYCMTFWYTMHRPDVDTLNVYRKTKQSGEQLIFSRKEDNMDKSWNETDIDISSNATFQIVIEGVAGKGYTGDIAIDDILLKSGLCTPETVTAQGTTTTKATPTTLSISPPVESPNTDNEGGSLAVYACVTVVVISLVAGVVIICIRRRVKYRPALGYIGRMPVNNHPPVLTDDRYVNHFLNSNAATTLNGNEPAVASNVYEELDNLQSTSDMSNTGYYSIELPEHSCEQMTNGAASLINTPTEQKSGTMDTPYLNTSY